MMEEGRFILEEGRFLLEDGRVYLGGGGIQKSLQILDLVIFKI